MDPLTPMALVAAIGCAHACWTDVGTGKILNVLTFPMMAAGLLMNPVFGGWQVGVYGLLLALALYYPLWYLKVQRGGDAKLWMGLGALLGPWLLLEASAWYAVLYVPMGLFVLVFRRRMGNLVAAAKGEAVEPTMLRTAPVITGAALFAFFTPWLEWLFAPLGRLFASLIGGGA